MHPDLNGIGFDVMETSVDGGDLITVEFEIENLGGRTAAAFDVDIYRSIDGMIDLTDLLLGTVLIGALGGGCQSWRNRPAQFPPAPGVDEVLMPGDLEQRTRVARSRDGIPIEDDVWKTLVNTAELVGVSV